MASHFIGEEFETDSNEEPEMEVSDDEISTDFIPRSYQLELFEVAKKKNSILVLGTGSGKTFISILLIKELAASIRGKLSEGAKRTVFVVNTVPLVYQQASAIRQQTGFSVGCFEGSMGVDFWSGDKWKEELDKHEVLVIVAQIFCDLILHARLELKDVNLIIMDECHHATGNHPMREIMRKYSEYKRSGCQVPRIMGLTACVVHSKLKPSDVKKSMQNLEEVMDSALVTSEDLECVRKHSTNAKEMFIKCPRKEETTLYTLLKERLIDIEKRKLAEIGRYSSLNKVNKCKIIKNVKKQFRGIHDISRDLGEYILPKAIKLQSEYLLESDSDNLIEQTILVGIGTELKELHSSCTLPLTDDPKKYLSGKVLRTLELLGQAQSKVTIIFVTRRNTSKLLCSLLLELREMDPKLSYLLPESVVGGTFNYKSDLKVSKNEVVKQKETIDRFRKGECNVIVSTSVLEEGVDIRKCNLVVRFDEPPNYRSYIQSIGRARGNPSHYIMFAYQEDMNTVVQAVECYKVINKELATYCFDRCIPSFEDQIRNFEEDEVEPPFAPFGVPGPQVTFNSAIQLINRYCGTLPQDKFTKLCVKVDKRKVGDKFSVTLTLPINAPCRMKVTGKPMANWEDAKKSAALEMCKQMYKRNLLDTSLLPKKAKIQAEESLQKYIKIPRESVDKAHPQPGTKRRRQVYKRKICRAFKDNRKDNLYLHLIYFQHIKSVEDVLLDTSGMNTKLGLLTAEPLTCSSFPLYSKKWGEVNVIVEPIRWVRCQPQLLGSIQAFHKHVSQLILKLNLDVMSFNPGKAGHSLFIVPLTEKNEIDVLQLDTFNESVDGYWNTGDMVKRRKVESFQFDLQKYSNYVISPSYRNIEMYYIDQVRYDESPLTPFPDNKLRYGSYMEYVKIEYNANVTNTTQPLLECKHFSKEFNYLPEKPEITKDRASKHPRFIPELCVVFPLITSLCCQILCMGSILHRINGLMLEQELFYSVGLCKRTNETDEKFQKSHLDYNWCEEVEQVVQGTPDDNLILKLQKKPLAIHPGMILQALTPLSCQENFNLERLEVLGDAYLKYSMGRFLFCKEETNHEGALTSQRSLLVSNQTLYMLAKDKGIVNMYQGVTLASNTAIPYGFEVNEEMESQMRRDKCPPQEWPTYSKTVDPVKREEFEEPYNPWTEQLVADKGAADCVEALIGVFLLVGGEASANHFLKWLGLTFIEEEISLPTTAVQTEMETLTVDSEANTDLPSQREPRTQHGFRSVQDLYHRSCLDRLEKILGYRFRDKSFLVQAVTHPSYVNNKVTDCYQRLEFFGDAILDILITSYIYKSFKKYSPGKLTDLRSHYVKNETLAKVAVKFGLYRFMLHMAPKLGGVIDAFICMLKDEEKEFNTEDDTLVAEDVEVPKALGDIVEALIGAVYVDSGGCMKTTWQVVKLLLAEEFESTRKDIPIDNVRALYERDPKVRIQLFPPTEDELAKCIIQMDGYPEVVGRGKNQRTAKQSGARLALARLDSQPKFTYRDQLFDNAEPLFEIFP